MAQKKPKYSQHFLVNQRLCRAIVELAEIAPADRVLEIGPGRGALSALLAERARELWLIEVDQALVTALRARFGGEEHVQIFHADALRFPYEQLTAPFKVVANLPYAVASPLLVRLLELRGNISRMVLMFQREVADRLVARPGTRHYGLLTVLARLAAEIRLEKIVSPGSFQPPPKVESAVVTVTPRAESLMAHEDEVRVVALARHGFAHRRKTIRNGLRQIPWPADAVDAALGAAMIDPARRPETLDLDDWGRLARASRALGLAP